MYSFESRVRYSEIDGERKLSLTGIINYLQDCSTFQSEDLQVGIDYLDQSRKAWWLSSWQIVIGRYPVLGEEIVISTWPYAFKGMYGYRNFTICDKEGNYLVKANSVWFLFDRKQGRPVRAGEAEIQAYRTGVREKLDMEYAPRRIELPQDYETAGTILVARHHIDTNHHVNNAQYVELAREVLPEEIRVKELRAEYKKAAVLGDKVCPRVTANGGSYTVALCSEKGSPYAVIWMRTAG